MTTMLEAVENAQYRRFERDAVPVRYRRESVASGVVVSLFAKIGKTLFRAENEYGVTIRTEQRDFILRAADLDGIIPAVGDMIEFDGRDYLVSAPNNEDVWRWHDRHHHRIMRVHSRDHGANAEVTP